MCDIESVKCQSELSLDGIRSLSFGNKVNIVYFDPDTKEQNDTHMGVVFGEMVGYDDGKSDSIKTILNQVYSGFCKVFLCQE